MLPVEGGPSGPIWDTGETGEAGAVSGDLGRALSLLSVARVDLVDLDSQRCFNAFTWSCTLHKHCKTPPSSKCVEKKQTSQLNSIHAACSSKGDENQNLQTWRKSVFKSKTATIKTRLQGLAWSLFLTVSHWAPLVAALLGLLRDAKTGVQTVSVEIESGKRQGQRSQWRNACNLGQSSGDKITGLKGLQYKQISCSTVHFESHQFLCFNL